MLHVLPPTDSLSLLSCQDAHWREALLLPGLSPQKRPYEQPQCSHSEESRDVLAGGRETDGHLGQDRRGHREGGRGCGHAGAEGCWWCDGGDCAPATAAAHLLQLTGVTVALLSSLALQTFYLCSQLINFAFCRLRETKVLDNPLT